MINCKLNYEKIKMILRNIQFKMRNIQKKVKILLLQEIQVNELRAKFNFNRVDAASNELFVAIDTFL